MMDFKGFAAEVEREIAARCGEGGHVNLQEVMADNGVRKTGICIVRDEKQEIIPVAYLDDFFLQAEHGMSMEGVVDRIMEKLKWGGHAAEECLAAIQKLGAWEDARDHVYPFLLSEKQNKEMQEVFAGRKLLDLDIFYMYRCEVEGMGYQRVRIKKTMLEQWGVTEPEVFQQAVENLHKDGYSVRNMGAVLRSLAPECAKVVEEAEEGGAVEMYVFTNNKMNYGAAGILMGKEYFQETMGGKNFYVLPSSLHELIFVPAERPEDGERFSRMVREVNETMLMEEEVLSDHAYFYDIESGLMSAA